MNDNGFPTVSDLSVLLAPLPLQSTEAGPS
jgi:hypothetical protein